MKQRDKTPKEKTFETNISSDHYSEGLEPIRNPDPFPEPYATNEFIHSPKAAYQIFNPKPLQARKDTAKVTIQDVEKERHERLSNAGAIGATKEIVRTLKKYGQVLVGNPNNMAVPTPIETIRKEKAQGQKFSRKWGVYLRKR